MAAEKNQLQNLGNGTYRVVGARVSPISGRYVVQQRESSSTFVSRSAATGRFVTRRVEGTAPVEQNALRDRI